ncbi:hypothetical protein FQN57_001177 [Myotisia sp. PD_48]|nr:hypothetical protein FQN57_001177 [Myotisia sp. PD_48]
MASSPSSSSPPGPEQATAASPFPQYLTPQSWDGIDASNKGFTGRHGRAYLVSGASRPGASRAAEASSASDSLPNTVAQKAVPRQLVTGSHTVSDISCLFCGTVLGWKYIAAEEESQKYKVGKFILETKRVCTSSVWTTETSHPCTSNDDGPNEVEFNSQDEDECEDLFLGVWTPELAERRRSKFKPHS